jgi:hypothetical protein
METEVCLLMRDELVSWEGRVSDAPSVHFNEGLEHWFEGVELVLVGQWGLIIIQNVDPLVKGLVFYEYEAFLIFITIKLELISLSQLIRDCLPIESYLMIFNRLCDTLEIVDDSQSGEYFWEFHEGNLVQIDCALSPMEIIGLEQLQSLMDAHDLFHDFIGRSLSRGQILVDQRT